MSVYISWECVICQEIRIVFNLYEAGGYEENLKCNEFFDLKLAECIYQRFSEGYIQVRVVDVKFI